MSRFGTYYNKTSTKQSDTYEIVEESESNFEHDVMPEEEFSGLLIRRMLEADTGSHLL